MLEQHKDMWYVHLGAIKSAPHQIHVKEGMRPIKQLPCRVGPQRCQLIDGHVDKMITAEVIEPSQSEWASLIVIEAKKDETPRFCIYYRHLNEITIPDTYQIPRMDNCIDSMVASTLCTALDANSTLSGR